MAHIQFRIDDAGRAADIETLASSGHRLLDRAAERAAHDAGALPAIYGWIRIPVRFSLTEGCAPQIVAGTRRAE